jgi:hypothetical protein
VNKAGNFEHIKQYCNKPGQPPANIPKEALHKKRFSMNHMLRRMLKQSPEKVFEYLGIPAPKRLTGDDKQTLKTIIATLLTKAMSGKTDAINVVFERLEGKAKQPIEMSGSGGSSLVSVMELPLELRIEILKQMLADAERELAEKSVNEIKVVDANVVEEVEEDVECGAVLGGEE